MTRDAACLNLSKIICRVGDYDAEGFWYVS